MGVAIATERGTCLSKFCGFWFFFSKRKMWSLWAVFDINVLLMAIVQHWIKLQDSCNQRL